MLFIPILFLAIGILFGIVIRTPISGPMATYLAVCCLAGLDTVCGGIRSALEKRFYADIFITGFASNAFIAFGLAWIGDCIGLDLFLAISIILGGRIFNNLSLIRRDILARWQDCKVSREMQGSQ